ncbi:hypothetical protein M406DRAFT_105776 [Cryphonectria parasitica EP155]|uniref:Zn(2)-C6 fungal-type domain-containing protein n=1 Tax=Cryphonectria parasitica (strain ATCC 38755 / EP155) TaxID=660469 RepID=A0A9P4Y2L0_CRYP1|nr:uncharacterized protein M406DRAFT_105776 [Cryphonectria parasitica EP155]KAF3765314.1 hypothetical protein M406DRAFT_105776 [Cryphonectria parasitica EP155]
MSDAQRPRKRSACDRCRAQKLRCHRDDTHPDDFCTRCIRSQVECITSSSKRPGRPTKHSASSSRGQNDADSIICREVAAPKDVGSIPHVAHVDEWFNFTPLDIDYEMPSAYWGSTDSHEMFSGQFHTSGDAGNVFTMSSLSSTATTTDTTSLNGLTETMLHGSSSGPGSQSDQDFDHTSMLPPTMPIDEPGLRISSLYRDLSQQISTLRSVPWDTNKVLRLTSIHDTSDELSRGCEDNSATNPLATISRTSAEFAELLRAFRVSDSETGSTAGELKSRLSTDPRLSMSDLLTTISCYILIVSIYDSIFSHCIAQSLQNPAQAGPKLFLGGIEVPTRPNMLGHLLFRVLDSQLRPIEELLGLPSEFCVSWKREPSNSENQTGLFSGRSGQSLFMALVQMETERTTDDRGGLGVVESLKENARRVQSLDNIE